MKILYCILPSQAKYSSNHSMAYISHVCSYIIYSRQASFGFVLYSAIYIYAFQLSIYFSMEAAKEDLGTAPMMHSSPFLKNMMVGMLLIPNCVAMFGLSSVLSLLREIFPAYSLANSAITGSIIQQGPHHGAQNSHQNWCVTANHKL